MADINDKFMRVGRRGTKTNLLTPGKSPSDTSIQVGSTIAWPTDTAVVFTMRSIDLSTGEEVAGTHTVWKGIVSGSSIDQLVKLQGPDNISYQAGDSTEVFIDNSTSYYDELYEGLTLEHNADGTHKMTTSFKRLIMDATIPVGTVWDYFGNEATLGTDFPGWLLVKNRNTNYARNDYPRLYDHLLQVQPAWVNTTNQTFSLNNLLGRVRVARDSADSDFSTLGETVGAKVHTLTTNQIPAHTHAIAHGEKVATSAGGGGYWGGTSGHTSNTKSTGGGEAHNNVQPTITAGLIIKF